jgi:hypothetical protein
MTDVVVTESNNSAVVQTTQTHNLVIDDKQATVIVTGMMPPASTSSISNSVDIDTTNLESGSTLVYNASTQQWTATKLLDQQIIESGQF